MDFNRYFKNEELESVIKKWGAEYPGILTVSSIGMSYEDRSIWLLTITNKDTGLDTEKPAVWIDGNIHASEVAGCTTSLYIAHKLVSEYGSDERITRLVDTSTFYIVPRVNPDGADLALADNPRFIRSGVRPYPWDDLQEGLHTQDIDGDGRILQIRIEDPNGDWKTSSLDPRLLERRALDDHGDRYYRLLPEGLIEDYDGYIIKVAPPLQRLDFNRNFPAEWRPEKEQQGAGPYPTSEIEIRAIVDFISKHSNINLGIGFHTFSGVILRPSGVKPDEELEADDVWIFKAICKRGTELTGYPGVSVYHDFRYHPKRVLSGAFDDWAYDHLGIYSFTIELWDIIERSGIKERKIIEWLRDHPHEDDHKILQWADENIGPDAYVDWYPFEHPQLGSVELGGWDMMYSWRNPPHKFMEEEASRNFPFMLSLGDMLPHLEIHTAEVSPIGENKYYFNLVVDNTGFLPTYTSVQAKNRNIVRPVRIELELPEDVKVINGKRKVEIGHLEGRSNKMFSLFSRSSPMDNRGRVEWVLQAQPGAKIKLNVLSDRAGTLYKEITLQ
jgi:murein tripeptide amidase MpaA